MSDTSIIWIVERSGGDWQVANLQLVTGGDLASAVLISLFTDRTANADDVIPDGTTDRRGWWGDTGEDFPIGSRLWLLSRAKLTQQTALRAKDYALEALQWLIADGVAASIGMTTEIIQPRTLRLMVLILRTGETAPTVLSYDWVWKEAA